MIGSLYWLEPKVLFLVTPFKQDSCGQANIRNLSYLEEPLEATDKQLILTYIKTFSTYVSDLAATLLGFAGNAEVSALLLVEDLESIHIQTEAAHRSLVQDEEMYW